MSTQTIAGNPIPLGPDDDIVRKTELIISGVLRGGVLLSVAIILGGAAWFFYLTASGGLAHPSFPDTLPAVWHGLLALNPPSIIVVGLLVLLATPVMRVAVSIIAFALEEDRTYVIITTLVLAILLFSIFGIGAWLGKPEPAMVQDGTLPFFFFVLLSSAFAGFVGALVGLGGGVFIVPILTLVFHVTFTAAIGASIVSVIATSSGAAAAYVKDRMTNLRVGMFLEVATTTGAICGALLSTLLDPTILFIVFGVVLLISALPLVMRLGEELPQGVTNHKWAEKLHLPGSYPDRRSHQDVAYNVAHIRWGFSMMWVAGMISGLLGIGSGAVKVLAMDEAMQIPFKVSTTTSNFMIGVTAAASAGVYLSRGYIDPTLAMPVTLGVLAGSLLGARYLVQARTHILRIVFAVVIAFLGVEMIYNGFTGRL